MLLDAGIPFRKIQEGLCFRIGEIDGVLISHKHGDHAKAVPELLRRGVEVYGPPDFCEMYAGTKTAYPLRSFGINTLTITAFDAVHDVDCNGYILDSSATNERLVYITDTAYIKYTFPGMTHLMVEANYSEKILLENVAAGTVPEAMAKRVIKSHMSIEQTEELCKAASSQFLRQIFLLHLSNSNSNAMEFSDRIKKATGAEVYIA